MRREWRRGDGPGLAVSDEGTAGTEDPAWMFCLGGQTLIPCRAPRWSTTKTRGHPPILSTSSPRSLSTRYAFIPPAPRVWVMLLFIKPSFVNELNEEGEGGWILTLAPLCLSPSFSAWFLTLSPILSRDRFSHDANTRRLRLLFLPHYPPNSQ